MKLIVTGSRGGLGSAVCAAAAREGHEVLGLDLRDGVDVTDSKTFLRATWAERFDALVHCAGTNEGASSLGLQSELVWRWVIDVNLTGARNAVVVALGSGVKRIVLVGSREVYAPRANFASYCVSKAGLAMLAQCVRLDYPSVGVTLVEPGGMNTPMIRSITDPEERRRRLADPADVANLIITAIESPIAPKTLVL